MLLPTLVIFIRYTIKSELLLFAFQGILDMIYLLKISIKNEIKNMNSYKL